MTNRWRSLLVLPIAAFASLAVAPAAGAAITSSQITTPASPTFAINDEEAPSTIAVSGTTSGGNPATDKVDLDCFYGPGPEDLTLAKEVPLSSEGDFSVPAAKLASIEDQVCRLRAVPASTIPADLSPFSGPVIATGERAKTAKIETGPNNGQPYDLYIWGQQLSAADDYDSLGSCGLDDGYLFDSEFKLTTTTFYCNDWFEQYDNNKENSASTRSEIQVDGANAYTPDAAEDINKEASPDFPTFSYSYSQNPANGNLTIKESDPIVKCPEATYPPTPVSCPMFESTGVTDSRTIEQTNEGHLVTITDHYESTDGQSHSLSLLPQNSQYFASRPNLHGEVIAYRFPGQGAFAKHAYGESVSLPGEAPSATFINVEGASEGDMETGQGAIILGQPASEATFNQVDSNQSEFYFHQTANVPAGGSATIQTAYAQAYSSTEVAALAEQAETDFKPAPPAQKAPIPPAPSNLFSFGKVTLNKHKGTASLQVMVPGAGLIVLSGKQVKQASLTASGMATIAMKITPTGKLVRKLKKSGKATVSVSVTFTPTGGTSKTLAKKVKLARKR